MDLLTIDEEKGIVRVFDNSEELWEVAVSNIKDASLADLSPLLSTHSRWVPVPGCLLYVWSSKGGKQEVVLAEMGKSLKELAKKWGKNKGDTFYRLVFMRPSDEFVPSGTIAQKDDKKRRSFKVDKKNKRVSAPRQVHTIGMTSTAGTPPSIAEEDDLPPPPPPSAFGGDGLPPPPPLGGDIPPPPPPADEGEGGYSIPPRIPSFPGLAAPPPVLGVPPPPPVGGLPPPPPGDLPVLPHNVSSTTLSYNGPSNPPPLSAPPPPSGAPPPLTVPPPLSAPPTHTSPTGLPPAIPQPVGVAAPPPPPPTSTGIPAPPPAPPAPPPPPKLSKKEEDAAKKAAKQAKEAESKAAKQRAEAEKKAAKQRAEAEKKARKAGKPWPPPGETAPSDAASIDKFISEVDAFVDPSGEYDYEAEEERPDFMITGDDLKDGWRNLNTSNANKIAKNEHFQKIIIAWINKKLEGKKIHITNLTADLQNGVVLIRLLETLSGQEVKKMYAHPKHVPEQLENLEIVIKFIAVLGLPIKAEPHDLYNGKMSTVCGIVYFLMQHYKDPSEKKKAKKKIDIKVEKLNAEKAKAYLARAKSNISESTLANRPKRSQIDASRFATSITPMSTVPVAKSGNTSSALVDAPLPPSMGAPSRPAPAPSHLPEIPAFRGPSGGLPPPILNAPTGLPPPISAPPPTIPKLPAGAAPKLPPGALPKGPAGAGLPPPIPSINKAPTQLLPAQLTIAEDEEINLDDLDVGDLLLDIENLDKFEINEADMIDIDTNPAVFGDLDDMKSFLEGVADEMGDIDFEDINLDF